MKVTSDLKTMEIFRRTRKVEWELWGFCPQEEVTTNSWSLASELLEKYNFIYMSRHLLKWIFSALFVLLFYVKSKHLKKKKPNYPINYLYDCCFFIRENFNKKV